MSEVSFKATVEVGSLGWTVTNTDDPDYGLMDGLKITRSTPDSDISPGQPNPAILSFGIVAETVGDIIPALEVGLPIAAGVWFPSTANDPAERFAGRVTDIDVTPHPRGVLIKVTAADYLADLAEEPDYDGHTIGGIWLTVGALDWVFDRYSMDTPPRLDLDGETSVSNPSTWFIKTGALTEVLESYLAQWAGFWLTGDTGLITGRYVIAPQLEGDNTGISPDLDTADPYVFLPVAVPRHQRLYRDAYEISGARVDVNGTYTRTKADAVTAIDVIYYDAADDDGGEPGESSVATSGTGKVRASLSTLLSDPTVAGATAVAFRPASDTDWRVDSFTWHLKGEPAGTYLPNPEPNIPGAYLGGPVDITNLDTRWSPVGTTYKGILAGYILTLERARPTVELDLRDALT